MRRVVERAAERRTGPLDEDVAEVGRHALGAEAPLGQRHRRRIPAALPVRGVGLAPMSAYAATARIERVRPRLAIGQPRVDDGRLWVGGSGGPG